jgi:hypothetical protein
MTEPTIPVEAAKAAKGLLKPMYDDLVQPAAKEVGTALGRTVRAALVPLRAVVWGAEQAEEYVHAALMKRLKHVPDDRIVTPKLNVAGPAVQALQFAGDEPVLREMYANLLATAMDRQTAEQAHPAFVEILKQLTPDEARILAYCPTTTSRPVISVFAKAVDGSGKQQALKHFSLIGVLAECEHSDLTASYLENLCRLGLTEIPAHVWYADQSLYEPLDNAPEILLLNEAIVARGRTPEIEHETFALTTFGKQFVKACVVERAAE